MKNLILLLIFIQRISFAETFIQEKTNNQITQEFIKVPEKIRVALVLGSGGARAFAHIGVIEELVNAGIPIDLIVGCSSGAAVGAFFADAPNVENLKSVIWGIKSHLLFDFDFWNCRYGIYQGANIRKLLQEQLSVSTFDQLQIPLVVVTTDLNTGELVSLGDGEIGSAVQASCSIPFFYTPCEINGRILIDGGVINPVPVKVARDLGAELIIAVTLSEQLPEANAYPSHLIDVFSKSADIYFLWQHKVSAESADIIIRPSMTGVGTFRDHMKFDLYEAGKQAAREKIEDIKLLMNNHSVDLSQILPSGVKRTVQLPIYSPK